MRSSAQAWKRSLIWRSSRSRPTNGASSPCDFSEPRSPETTRCARQSGVGPSLPFSSKRARVLVDDRLLGRPARRLADEDRPGLGGRLHPRRGVDEVAGDHALALGADRDGGLAGEHARPRAQLRCADLVAERGHGGDEVERGADSALGVVLGRGRRAPHGHHRVADELLDRAAVELDQAPARVEVAREQLARVLRVALLRERREADEVGEEHRDQAALGGGRGTGTPRAAAALPERRAALPAELLARLVRRSA